MAFMDVLLISFLGIISDLNAFSNLIRYLVEFFVENTYSFHMTTLSSMQITLKVTSYEYSFVHSMSLRMILRKKDGDPDPLHEP